MARSVSGAAPMRGIPGPPRDCPRFVYDASPVEPIIRAALSGILSSMRCVHPRTPPERRTPAHRTGRKTQPTTDTENRK
ncbi:hypothetical protein [Burkholderia pseudomultivorans]|uniref:hypothetical protein n=1 Tax=Burkholderia pseudomultivorans TaxID=1207504 RepID=UPI00188FD417|nr:hypothetical protein [Burkholderia pseudomultivorans]MBF5010852.1 hypothetical protein [Burkholderia pseudomultivorans]